MGVICIRRKSSAIAPFTLYDLGAGEGPTELPEVTERITVTTRATRLFAC